MHCDALSVANTVLSTPRWKVTGIPLVPSMIHQLVNSPEWEKTDTSSIKITKSAAAFLPPELLAKFRSKLGSTPYQSYGSSESVRAPHFASTIMKIHAPKFTQPMAITVTMRENCIPGYKPVDESVGILMSGLQARIVGEDGTDCGIGEPGELWVKGDCISRGYFNDEQATARTFTRDGWLKMGDIFTIDEKGNY